MQTLFMPESASPDSHAQGMAMILRLRGYQQFHDARGWSLFQLAHHRLVSTSTSSKPLLIGLAKAADGKETKPAPRVFGVVRLVGPV